SDPPVWLDQALDIRCKVEFVFKGFGTLTQGDANSLTDSSATWSTEDSGEWAGDVVYLVSGPGAGQFAEIASNSATALQLSTALVYPPAAGTKYMVNHGKTVEITTTWEYMGKEYFQTIESLVINYRNSSDWGF
ncbi:hypothetical protein HQ520_18385, partial [bacterium]|nr:hypothetical protein [bacterium]